MAIYFNTRTRSWSPRPVGPPTINWASNQSRGLIAWYPMTGLMPSALEMINGRLAPSAGITNVKPVFDPVMGACYEFGGASSQFFAIPATVTAQLLTEATCSFWVKLRNATPSVESKTGFPVTLDAEAIGLNSHYPYLDGTVYTSMFRTARDSFTPLAGVNRADWHLVTVTSAPSVLNWFFYQNGIQARVANADATISTSQSKEIGGSNQTADYYLDGWLCDVRVYNRALSAAEVLALYAPQTRWELYRQPSRMMFFDVGAAPPATRLSRLPLMGVG